MKRIDYIRAVNEALGGSASGRVRSRIFNRKTGRYYTNAWLARGKPDKVGRSPGMSRDLLRDAVAAHLKGERRGKRRKATKREREVFERLPTQRYYTSDVRPGEKAPRGFAYVGSWRAKVRETFTDRHTGEQSTALYVCVGPISASDRLTYDEAPDDPRPHQAYMVSLIREQFREGDAAILETLERDGVKKRAEGSDANRYVRGTADITVSDIETFVQVLKLGTKTTHGRDVRW